MGIDLRQNGRGFDELRTHVGHKIEVVAYGKRKKPMNVAISCETCSEILVDFNPPESVELELVLETVPRIQS